MNPRSFVEQERQAILGLLCEAIAIDSTTGSEGELARFCAEWLEQSGIQAILQPCKDRHNLVGLVGPQSAGGRTLVLSGHLDTVPASTGEWTHGPHNPVRSEGRVFGLGASDLKASLAATFFAARYLREHAGGIASGGGRLVTAFTIEEETTGDGTRGFLEWSALEAFLDPPRTAAVVTEPTNLDHICLGNRGTVFLEIAIRGLSGHGSRPHLSRNPIPKLQRVLFDLRELERDLGLRFADEQLGAPTLTPTSLEAGHARRMNVIPSLARATIDCRLTPALYESGFTGLRAELERFRAAALEQGFEVELSLHHPREGHKLSSDHPLAQLGLAVLRDCLNIDACFAYSPAGNDAVFFGNAGIATINKVGPGDPAQAHRSDEFVREDKVLAGTLFFIELALRYFEQQMDPA